MKSLWEKYSKLYKSKLGPTVFLLSIFITIELFTLKGITLFVFLSLSTYFILRFQTIDRSKWYQEKWLAPIIGCALSLIFYDLWSSNQFKESNSEVASALQLIIGVLYPALFWLLIRLTQKHKEAETESLEIRQSLEKSETLFQNLLNSIPLGIFKAKPNGAWVFVNDEWGHLTGQDIVSAHDNGWIEAIEPADRENLAREIEIAQFRNAGFSTDVRLAASNNTLTWVNISMKPLFAPDRSLDGFIGTIENRTEKKRIEALLKTSQKIDRFLSADPSYREILKPTLAIIGQSFDIQFAAFWDIDTQEQKLRLSEFWSPQLPHLNEFISVSKHVMFISNNDLPARAWGARTPILVTDLEADANFHRASQAKNVGFHGAVAIPIVIDKTFLGVMEFFSKYKMVFSASDLEEFSGFATRIGQVLIKKKAEEELTYVRQYVEQQTAAINTFAIISIADTDGTITYVNDNFLKVSQYQREEILGRDHRLLASGLHDKAFFTELWSTIHQGKPWKGEICNKAKDGSLYWLESTIVPFVNSEGVITQYVAIYSNITDRKQAERKLLESAKMSSLGEMAGGIAHEINNPLTIIAGMAETISRTLKRQPIDLPRLEKSSDRIQSTVERISKIIKGLKTFARDGSRDDFEFYPVIQLLSETVEFCGARFYERGIQLRVNMPSNDLTLKCRPVEVEQALLNLLNNAMDAIVNLPEKWISLSTDVNEAQDIFRIRITDSGTGICPHIQEKLFTPFFTTKGIGQGTGLGLSISQGIILQHGGTLSLDNTSPNTCFILEFSLTANQQTQKAS